MFITHVIAGFSRDWEHLVRTADVGWAREFPVLAGVQSVQDVLHRIWGSQADDVLALLLRAHQDGQSAAGRIVVQTMLPKLVQLALHRSPAAQAGDLLGDFVASLWMVIDGYPVARRPRRIAANLFMDAMKQTRAQLPPQADQLVEPMSDGVDGCQEPEAAPEAFGEAARMLRLAEKRGLITSRVRAAMWSVYIDGLSSVQAAARVGSTPAAVRYHCSHGVRRLKPHRALLAA